MFFVRDNINNIVIESRKNYFLMQSTVKLDYFVRIKENSGKTVTQSTKQLCSCLFEVLYISLTQRLF